uniref:Adenylate kinase isoenzyme 6 homolog n=1 Tax=Globodera pallida TaxID=36090 RepID=A0A183BQK4_GLOPA
MRQRPNVLITGTPGTGKSTLAKKVAENVGFEHVDSASTIKENNFFADYDAQLDTHVLDEDAFLDHLEERFGADEGGLILDYHCADMFPKRWFDLVVVLRCATESLFDRLAERGYSERKRRENLEAEIFGVLSEEAKQSYDEAIVHELDNSTAAQLEANVRTVTNLVGSDSRSRRNDLETNQIMGKDRLDNAAPVVHATKARRALSEEDASATLDDDMEEPIDAAEIFEHIRDINDPEHPYTLEQLNVVQEELVRVSTDPDDPFVDVRFTPTIPHCSMAALIGLAIHAKLKRSLHPSMKICVRITPGSHSTEESINRQLADKERVAAAMENIGLMQSINACLRPKE